MHPFFKDHSFYGFVHRGGDEEKTENTLEAFQYSSDLGFVFMETDVQSTSDGKVVIFHDSDLKRVAGLNKRVSDLTFKEIKEVDLINGGTIPSLEETLSSFPNLRFNIDIKVDSAVEETIRIVKNHNALTVWVALDKSNKLNGGVTYLKGSHKYGLVKHINSFAPGSSQKIDTKIIKKYKSLKKVTPSLEPGDALIHHCLTFHGSSRNKTKKNRLGFTMQFKDKTSSYDMDQLRRYQRRLKKQILIRKKNKI